MSIENGVFKYVPLKYTTATQIKDSVYGKSASSFIILVWDFR